MGQRQQVSRVVNALGAEPLNVTLGLFHHMMPSSAASCGPCCILERFKRRVTARGRDITAAASDGYTTSRGDLCCLGRFSSFDDDVPVRGKTGCSLAFDVQ